MYTCVPAYLEENQCVHVYQNLVVHHCVPVHLDVHQYIVCTGVSGYVYQDVVCCLGRSKCKVCVYVSYFHTSLTFNLGYYTIVLLYTKISQEHM